MAEAYPTIGVDPTASMEEVASVYYAKVKYAHPNGSQDLEERKVREDRTKRLNLAYQTIRSDRRRRSG